MARRDGPIRRYGTAVCRCDAAALAMLRLLLAVICVVLAVTNHNEVAVRFEGDDVIALGYLAFAAVAAFMAVRHLDIDHQSTPLVLLVDVALFAAAPYIGLANANDSVIICASFLIVIVLTTSLRWDVAAGVRVAVMLNVLAYAVFLANARNIPVEEDIYTRRITFTLIPSIFAIWLARRISLAQRTADFSNIVALDDSTLQVMAAACRTALTCGRVSISWAARGAWFEHVEHPEGWRDAAMDQLDRVVNAGEEIEVVVFPVTPSAFAGTLVLRDGWSVDCVRDSKPRARTEGAESTGPYFVAAIRTAEGFGLIVASDFLLTSWTDLRIFHGMARDVRFEFQNLAASALLQDNEVLRVRNAIARDLHDSVAQALAGAKFWIGGLIEETGPANQREELVRLRDAMEMETSNLRSIIETLRTRDTLALATEFPAVLRETLGALQEQWRIAIDLDAAIEAGATVDVATSFAVQQILREAVSNAVRHGHAKAIHVQCELSESLLRLCVEDDGTGFVRPVQPRTLAERVTALDGTLSISSQPGNTVIRVILRIGAALDQGNDC